MKSILLLALLAAPLHAEDAAWESIFNGEDLTGWTPKIRGLELGEDPKNTFVVRDGVMAVDYSNYEKWDSDFGHIFYETELSHYRVRLEYRFIGEQLEGGPGWATANSGIMLHCQDPKTIGKDQDFPVSLEFQLLSKFDGPRTTANLCTPGTYVTIDGEVNKNHCINCETQAAPVGEWQTAEAEVRGGKVIKHLINGEVAIEYTNPQLDGADGDAQPLIELKGDAELTSGWVSLQSESHPCEFRKIEILKLEEE